MTVRLLLPTGLRPVNGPPGLDRLDRASRPFQLRPARCSPASRSSRSSRRRGVGFGPTTEIKTCRGSALAQGQLPCEMRGPTAPHAVRAVTVKRPGRRSSTVRRYRHYVSGVVRSSPRCGRRIVESSPSRRPTGTFELVAFPRSPRRSDTRRGGVLFVCHGFGDGNPRGDHGVACIKIFRGSSGCRGRAAAGFIRRSRRATSRSAGSPSSRARSRARRRCSRRGARRARTRRGRRRSRWRRTRPARAPRASSR